MGSLLRRDDDLEIKQDRVPSSLRNYATRASCAHPEDSSDVTPDRLPPHLALSQVNEARDIFSSRFTRRRGRVFAFEKMRNRCELPHHAARIRTARDRCRDKPMFADRPLSCVRYVTARCSSRIAAERFLSFVNLGATRRAMSDARFGLLLPRAGRGAAGRAQAQKGP